MLARHLAGSAAAYDGSVVATNLKVSGVSVFSAGDFMGARGQRRPSCSAMSRRGTYKKLVISDGRLTGAVLVGDIADALWYLELIRTREPIAAIRSDMMFGRSLALPSKAAWQMMRTAMTSVDPTLRATRTTCPYCGVGCGVLATPDGSGGAAIAGDPEHPANFGRLCSKGSALGETLGLEDRLLYPMIRSQGRAWSGWPGATRSTMSRIASQHIVARDGPDAVAFYLSGQLLTEDYYVANKLMKGFIGTANVDTNSRLCMSSSVAGHRRAFGADTVPGCYEDLDAGRSPGAGRLQRGVVPSGAVPAHARQQAGARRAHRRDRSAPHRHRRRCRPVSGAEARHRHRAVLRPAGASRRQWRARSRLHRAAHQRLRRRAGARAQHRRQRRRDRARDRPHRAGRRAFFQMFRDTPRVVTLYSQGVNQSAQGTDKVNAILNCHLATGRIGKPGASPFSLTGQPNAMGGREVGGLANQLAAHMGFTPPDIDRVRRFWKAPRIATHEGLKAVQMFEAIGRGEIKALWVMGTNPGGVAAGRRRRARGAEEARAVRGLGERASPTTPSSAGPHVLLPAQAWGEKSGTVTNSERRISRQRAFLPPPGEAKPDWWIVSEVAKRLGFGAAFDFNSAADMFREHAALSAFENNGSRDFDIGALHVAVGRGVRCDGAGAVADAAGDIEPQQRFFAEGGFFTNDRKARFVAPEIPALRTETSAGAAAAAQHRPHPRPVAHHDAHRHEPAAGPASAGAVRRDSSRRREPIRRRR